MPPPTLPAVAPPPRPAHAARQTAITASPGARIPLRRITFRGHFAEYYIISLGLAVLCGLTLGLAIPFALYWQIRYYFTNLTVDGQPVVFTGSFAGYVVKAFGLVLLSAVTFGLALPYLGYWSVKYFFDHMDLAPARGEAFHPGGR